MVACQEVCLRRLSNGERAWEVGAGRLLAHRKVTVERLIEGWGEQTASAVSGRHVLALQDTSEINFRTTARRQRGLGEIGKGVGRGVLAHVMLALDAGNGSCLGLVGGSIYTRAGRVEISHAKRALADKESRRWVETAEAARTTLSAAARVTVVADRESDFYAAWARVPQGDDFHMLVRATCDRAVVGGGTLSDVVARWQVVDQRPVALPATHKRAARKTVLSLSFGAVEVLRPDGADLRDLPRSQKLRLVEVIEREPPAGVEPIHWRLLTSHQVDDAAAAWQIVDWYRQRWTIEQLFRLMKTQGLRIEDSQLADAAGLIKLTAIAARAATVILQMVQARHGASAEPAAIAFTPPEIAVLDSLGGKLEGKTAAQKNPHPAHSLAWAAWIIAKLGGWNGYARAKPPGPITFRHGLDYFHALVAGWQLRDLCIP
jgi:hypothetical protein